MKGIQCTPLNRTGKPIKLSVRELKSAILELAIRTYHAKLPSNPSLQLLKPHPSQNPLHISSSLKP
jgi:hypothetical protein